MINKQNTRNEKYHKNLWKAALPMGVLLSLFGSVGCGSSKPETASARPSGMAETQPPGSSTQQSGTLTPQKRNPDL